MAAPSLGGSQKVTASQVLAYAQQFSENGTDLGPDMCQRFVRQAFGSPGGADTALDAWNQANFKHTAGTPPPGAAVYWGGGSGHVAISAGNGMVYSTDVRRPGQVDLVPMNFITQHWGKPLLGWSADNNGIKIAKWDATPVANNGKGGGPIDYTTQGGGAATGENKKQLAERYGYAAAVYADVPQIQKLVREGQKGGWTADEFAHRVEGTKWFQNHTEEEKQFVLLSTSNPAEAEQRVNQKVTDLRNQYRQMGVPIDPARLQEIAKASVVHGWTPQQEQNALASEFDYNPKNTYGGTAGLTVDQLRQTAASYIVPLSNKTLDKWTSAVLRGDATPESFNTYLKAQAKSAFPEMSDAIDRGITPEDYLSPYKETAASTLGIDPEKVDWMDPKWQQAIFRTDDKGARAVMPLSDWNRTLRTDDRFGYDSSQNGQGQAATFTSKLAQLMGAQ
jgi:hypothetical protein